MHKLKLFLLSVLTPLLCIGVSFGYSLDLSSFDYIGEYGHSYVDGSNFNYDYSISATLSSDKLYCLAVKSFICEYPSSWGGGSCSYALDLNLNNTNHTFSYFFTNSVVINSKSSINIPENIGNVRCFLSEANGFAPISQVPDYVGFKFDLYSKDIFSGSDSDCSDIESDFNTCLDRVNTMNGQVASLSGSLSSCQSDLASCTNSCDTLVSQCQSDKSALQSSLSGCNEEKESLQNYNSSLSNQLNECLSNGGSGSLSLTGCNSFSVFWNQDGNPFSLPITNNLFLPNGLRSVITGGVQSIEQVDKPIYDFASSEDLSNSFNKILLFMFAMPMFALFVYYIKKYLFTLFMPEK